MQAQSGREGNSTPSATRRENAPQRGGLNRGSAGAAGGDLGNFSDTDWDNFLNSNDTRLPAGPITGENFAPWSDRLRDVEEMLDQPELRNEVAAARERARRMRLDFKRLNQKPDWAVVRLQVVKPLVEVRNAITEELARRDSKDSLVPIDRDPVPSRFAERVRRYYEELGKDK